MLRQHQDSLLPRFAQPRSSLVWCVLIVCLTLLIFTYLTRKSLCEIRYRDGYREVAAFMAYESGK
ncbi:small toxic polypeptide [Escherichia coli]|nr:small toxic polypeptide [Escherichia coli]HBP1325641.1 Hok/Gef family protein [Escherichia coli str. K-12 substr. MG1655star]